MEKLVKISFIIALVGILILIILSQQISPEIINVEDAKNMSVHKPVAITGRILSVNDYDGFQVLLLQDSTGIMKITSYSKKPIDKPTEEVLIIGKIDIYQEEKQVQADKIIIIEN